MAEQVEQKLYTIGAFSKVVGISISTLRYYDEKDILMPKVRDDNTNYRYYVESQVMEAFCLRQMKNLGVPLQDIKVVLKSRNIDDLRTSLKARMRDCLGELRMVQAQHKSALHTYTQMGFGQEILRHLRADDGTTKSLQGYEIRYVPETDVVQQKCATRGFGYSSSIHGCVDLCLICEQEGLQLNGALHMTFMEHTPDRFTSGDYDSLLIFPIVPTGSNHPAIQKFGGFWAISTMHVGPYSGMPQLYESIQNLIDQHGLEASGDPYEEYLLNHFHVSDQMDYVTRLSFPIKEPEQSLEFAL